MNECPCCTQTIIQPIINYDSPRGSGSYQKALLFIHNIGLEIPGPDHNNPIICYYTLLNHMTNYLKQCDECPICYTTLTTSSTPGSPRITGMYAKTCGFLNYLGMTQGLGPNEPTINTHNLVSNISYAIQNNSNI